MSNEQRKYKLKEQIARGGMGEVFRATSFGAQGFQRPVAIKRLHEGRAEDVDARIMLQQEGQLCALLDHPNIMPVWDLDEDSKKCPRLVMPFVDGVDLHHLMRSERLPIAVSVYITVSVLRGLAHIHAAGIVHRDIKPGNILISRAGAVRITDFGLARDPHGSHLAAHMDAGTYGYMSPEALQGDPPDARNDLFSVGAMLYEMLTGKPAFPGYTPRQRIAYTFGRTPPAPAEVNPEISPDLSDVTMRLLADRAARFPSADAVIDALPNPKYGMEDLAEIVQTRLEHGQNAPPASEAEPRDAEYLATRRTNRHGHLRASDEDRDDSDHDRDDDLDDSYNDRDDPDASVDDRDDDPIDSVDVDAREADAIPEDISRDIEIALPAPRLHPTGPWWRRAAITLAVIVVLLLVALLRPESPRRVHPDSRQAHRSSDGSIAESPTREPISRGHEPTTRESTGTTHGPTAGENAPISHATPAVTRADAPTATAAPTGPARPQPASNLASGRRPAPGAAHRRHRPRPASITSPTPPGASTPIQEAAPQAPVPQSRATDTPGADPARVTTDIRIGQTLPGSITIQKGDD